MNSKQLQAIFGLKWNPFLPNIPVESLWAAPEMDTFLFRIENLVMDGGFAMICGEPGLGKSKNLQLLAHRLEQLDNVIVGVMERPQSNLGDFYRELGELFGVNLSPANRYGGFTALRKRWKEHIKSTLFRPVLLIDEAQEMMTCSLNELRLLGSAKFDSECLLTVVLCGDTRLPERFRSSTLLGLGSRIRFRRLLEPYEKQDLQDYLEHCLEQAGAPHLMTKTLMGTLVEHSAGNLRLLNIMAAELLDAGAQQELAQLDEKLFLQIYSRNPQKNKSH
ncbi:MAG: ATP-binding protein [Desulfobacterales bacterium]|nr:ATP-binding protein [Desulfobacterales bacterium]